MPKTYTIDPNWAAVKFLVFAYPFNALHTVSLPNLTNSDHIEAEKHFLFGLLAPLVIL